MEEHRDIYAKPPAKPEESAPVLPAPEPAPAELRAMTRRRIAYSIALMILILGSAALFFYHEERSREAEGEETIDAPAGRSGRPAPLASIPAVGSEELPISLDSPPSQAPPDMQPQRLAEIMALLREASDLMRSREWDAAEARIRQVLSMWPNMNTALRLLGVLYIQRGQFDQAIILLERALKADPFNVDTFVNLAIAHMQQGRLEQAEDLLLTAIQLRPDISVTHINIGLLYILWGRYDQAAEHLQIAVQRMPDNHSARNNLGVALLRLGRHGEAREHFRYLMNRQPDRPEAYFNAAITFVLDRNYADAFSMLRQGIARCSPVDARRHLMDSDFDSIRELPEFRALWSELSDPRRMSSPPSS
jgi:tetratricopeptide (TPR) repeat protein